MRACVRMALVVSTLLSLTGCGADSESDTHRDRTLVVPRGGSHWSMSPGNDDTPRRLVFQHMVMYRDLWCGEPEGEIARSWEHNEDLTEWTVHLREDNLWHDGVPVTAHDIRFTLELWRHPDVDYWYGHAYDSSVVVDDHTIRVHFNQPSRLLLDSWIVYYPRHLLADLDPAGFYDWEFWTRPVGNGPFRYVRHVPDLLTEYEPNPDYHRGPPGIDRLVLRYGSGTIPQLLAGDVDMLLDVSPIEAMHVKDDPRFRVYHEQIPAGRYLVWNTAKPQFDDVRVRRALTMALDRRELHAVLGYGDALPITDGIYTPCQYMRRDLADPLPYDPEGARALLDEAGWIDRDGDGVRERGNTELRFELAVADELGRQTGVFIKQMLARVGAQVEVATYEQTVVGDLFRERGDYDVVIGGTAGGGWGFIAQALGPNRRLAWADPEATALVAEAWELATYERDSLIAAANERVLEGLPLTYLYPAVATYVVPARLKGLRDDRGPLAYLWNARLEPSR